MKTQLVEIAIKDYNISRLFSQQNLYEFVIFFSHLCKVRKIKENINYSKRLYNNGNIMCVLLHQNAHEFAINLNTHIHITFVTSGVCFLNKPHTGLLHY
jgi:hypothetical protein